MRYVIIFTVLLVVYTQAEVASAGDGVVAVPSTISGDASFAEQQEEKAVYRPMLLKV